MTNNTLKKFVITACLSISTLLICSADQSISSRSASGDEGLINTPKGVAPLSGLAVFLPENSADSRDYAWSLRLSCPKVVWEIIGKNRAKLESSKIKADVEMITLDLAMGYSEATQLSVEGQNRVVDLKGKRLTRDEAKKRLGSSAPVIVSVSGEMPDPFYLKSLKSDTLVILFGLSSSREYNLLPRMRAPRNIAE